LATKDTKVLATKVTKSTKIFVFFVFFVADVFFFVARFLRVVAMTAYGRTHIITKRTGVKPKGTKGLATEVTRSTKIFFVFFVANVFVHCSENGPTS
jgi:hypothetical protein